MLFFKIFSKNFLFFLKFYLFKRHCRRRLRQRVQDRQYSTQYRSGRWWSVKTLFVVLLKKTFCRSGIYDLTMIVVHVVPTLKVRFIRTNIFGKKEFRCGLIRNSRPKNFFIVISLLCKSSNYPTLSPSPSPVSRIEPEMKSTLKLFENNLKNFEKKNTRKIIF